MDHILYPHFFLQAIVGHILYFLSSVCLTGCTRQYSLSSLFFLFFIYLLDAMMDHIFYPLLCMSHMLMWISFPCCTGCRVVKHILYSVFCGSFRLWWAMLSMCFAGYSRPCFALSRFLSFKQWWTLFSVLCIVYVLQVMVDHVSILPFLVCVLKAVVWHVLHTLPSCMSSSYCRP